MGDLKLPPFGQLVTRELDGGEPVAAGELPAGLTVDDYVWFREVLRRYRELVKAGVRRPGPFDAFPKH